jgi:transcription elongation factor
MITAPNPANGGRTPSWKQAANDGGRTPAWHMDGSRTVNPYDGSRTAYGAGNRTPAWAASGAKTPAYDGFGSSGHGSSGAGDAWGSKTPAYHAGSGASHNEWGANAGASWGAGAHSFDAPTPGAGLSAPTPAAMNAYPGCIFGSHARGECAYSWCGLGRWMGWCGIRSNAGRDCCYACGGWWRVLWCAYSCWVWRAGDARCVGRGRRRWTEV